MDEKKPPCISKPIYQNARIVYSPHTGLTLVEKAFVWMKKHETATRIIASAIGYLIGTGLTMLFLLLTGRIQ